MHMNQDNAIYTEIDVSYYSQNNGYNTGLSAKVKFSSFHNTIFTKICILLRVEGIFCGAL